MVLKVKNRNYNNEGNNNDNNNDNKSDNNSHNNNDNNDDNNNINDGVLACRGHQQMSDPPWVAKLRQTVSKKTI